MNNILAKLLNSFLFEIHNFSVQNILVIGLPASAMNVERWKEYHSYTDTQKAQNPEQS